MLIPEEGAVLVRIARAAFFRHFGDNSASTAAQRISSTLRRRMGAYVEAEFSTGQNTSKGLVLGLTGVPDAKKQPIKR